MSRRVAIFTGTRAEYGLLYWVMREIQNVTGSELQIIVSGAHLSPEFGETWRVIESDGFSISDKVEMILSSDSSVGVVKSMGLGMIAYADSLERLKPDIVVVLGDRFEALAFAQAALIMKVPIAHIHGGELTEGAYDDAIRHAITKLSNLHFTATETYRNRVIQMGEAPETVFNVGAVGLDYIENTKLLDCHELSASLNIDLNAPFILVTYHPVTAGHEDPESTIQEILGALDQFPEFKVIVTYPNADNGGRAIVYAIEEYAKGNPGRVLVVQSLGSQRYLSALNLATVLVGNSSSGIIEAPALRIPTVNIGVRQSGRLASDTVIHCKPVREAIVTAIETAISPEFKELCKIAPSLYGCGGASAKIVAEILNNTGPFNKHFHDLKSNK